VDLGQRLVSASLAAAVALAAARFEAAEPPFIDAADATGLTFTHHNGAAGKFAIAEVMGAGVALLDYDGDDDLDVWLVEGGPIDAARGAQSRLFRNDLAVDASGRRTLRFTDVTARAGITPHGYGMGAATGDYDNDGDPDVYVTAFGHNALYRNNGDGTFSDVTAAARVDDPRWSTSAAFVDYDRDGDLDLIVVNYLDFTLAGNKLCYDTTGARDYCGPRSFQPVPSRLFRNDGNGVFSDASAASGIAGVYGAGLGVTVGDYNNDGWLDLYIANDATPNQLWINQKNGTFADDGPLSGVAVNAAGNPEGSMGVASGDYDGDGDEDLFVTNIAGETFALYQNDGRGAFDDVRVRAGVGRPTAAFTGFGTEWIDYDSDGWLDLIAVNGAVNMVERLRGQPNPFRMRSLLFHNDGDGRLRDVSAEAGPAILHEAVSRGAAVGDIDNDGDPDVVVTINGGPARLLLAQAPRANHWMRLRLEQPTGNRLAMGARVGVERTGRPTLWRRVRTDGSYLSASDPRVHVGLGPSATIDGVVVTWPDGVRERFTSVDRDRTVTLRRGAGRPVP
jgi:hypothetical protein